MFGSKLPRDNQREGMGKGRVLVEKQVVEGRGLYKLKPWVSLLRSTPMKMEQIASSETSALKAQMPGDYRKDTIRQVLKCLSPVVLI